MATIKRKKEQKQARRSRKPIYLRLKVLTPEEIINADENTLIMPELFLSFKSTHYLYKPTKIYKDILNHLLGGMTLLGAFSTISVKYNITLETAQNYFIRTINLLREELKSTGDTESEYPTSLECFVTDNVYREIVIGKSVPNERTGRSKEVVYLKVPQSTLPNISNRHLEIYQQFLNEIESGEYIGYTHTKLSKEFNLTYSGLDTIIPKVRDAIMEELKLTLNRIVYKADLEETEEKSDTSSSYSPDYDRKLSLTKVENTPIVAIHDLVTYIEEVCNERDFYKSKYEELLKEVERFYINLKS